MIKRFAFLAASVLVSFHASAAGGEVSVAKKSPGRCVIRWAEV